MGYTGYDNFDKKYTMFWIDNSSTDMFTGEGSFDRAGKELTMYGKMDDPTTDEHDKNVSYVLRWLDNDNFVFEMRDLSMGGSNTMMGEIKYRRKK